LRLVLFRLEWVGSQSDFEVYFQWFDERNEPGKEL